MTKQTASLTNLDPNIVDFQTNILNQYIEKNQTARQGQIVFVGSSTTEIFPIETFQQEQDLGLTKTIYNRGIRATTTADLLKNIKPLVFDLAPSKLFINIGSNDIGFNVPEATYLANYEKILRQITSQLPDTQVYVMKYYPVNTVDNFGEEQAEHTQLYQHRSNDLLAEANKKTAQLAQKYGCIYIDANANLTDAAGNLRKELTFDGAHMLPSGYQIVLANLLPYLQA